MGGVVLVFMAIVAVVIYFIRGVANSKFTKCCTLEAFWIVVFVLMGAFVYAFGSGNILMRQASGAFVFFVSASISILYFVFKLNPRSVSLSLFCSMVTMSVLLVFQGAMSSPYRADTIAAQTVQVTIGQGASTIYVDFKTKEYIERLTVEAMKNGWIAGTPLIDLTGGNPGVAYILGAVAPGFPWLLGGYSGSEKFAKIALGYADKKNIDRAWVLTSHKGPRRIQETILKELGVVFPERYKLVGEFTRPLRMEIQQLYKPTE
jgi:hypothetical protein